MTYRERRQDKPAGKPTRHWGFNSSGAVFWQDSPVDNATTTRARELARRIVAERMTPWAVSQELATAPEWFRLAFGEQVAADWSLFDHLHQWGSARSHNSLSEYVKRAGVAALEASQASKDAPGTQNGVPDGSAEDGPILALLDKYGWEPIQSPAGRRIVRKG